MYARVDGNPSDYYRYLFSSYSVDGMRKARLKGKPLMSNNVEKNRGAKRREGEREANKETRTKPLQKKMCSRAPSSFSIRPEDSSPKHSIETGCLPACLHQRDVWIPAPLGGPPLAGVDLGPNHTHDLLLHLRLLGVDVGISYLAIFIHKEEACTDVVGYRTYPDVTVFLQIL